jgi:hypothetical protein
MDQTHHNILLYIIYLSNSLIFKSFLIVYLIIYQGLLNSTTLHIINYILINNTRHLSTCPNQLTEVFIIFSVIGATSTLSLLLSFLILESSLRTHSMQHLHHLHLLYSYIGSLPFNNMSHITSSVLIYCYTITFSFNLSGIFVTYKSVEICLYFNHLT